MGVLNTRRWMRLRLNLQVVLPLHLNKHLRIVTAGKRLKRTGNHLVSTSQSVSLIRIPKPERPVPVKVTRIRKSKTHPAAVPFLNPSPRKSSRVLASLVRAFVLGSSFLGANS